VPPQILAHGAAAETRITPVDRLSRRNATAAVGIGLHDAGIGSETFATHQIFSHAAPGHILEQVTKDIALAESTVPVLRETRMIWNPVLESEPARPGIGQVPLDLFT